MAQNAVSCLRENHAPGQVSRGDSSPKFSVNKVSESTEEKSERHQRSNKIANREDGFLVSPREIKERKNDADESAVRAHTTLPYREDFKRMCQVVFRLIEQHKTQAAADDHADHADKEQIFKIRLGYSSPLLTAAVETQEIKKRKADQIHQTVPMHGQWSRLNGNRIKLRMNQHSLGLVFRTEVLDVTFNVLQNFQTVLISTGSGFFELFVELSKRS